MIKIEIYTLGHSNYSFDKFIEILKKYNINCVVDIRAIPYSKYNTQYNKEFFQANLKKLGYTYIYIWLMNLALKGELEIVIMIKDMRILIK